MSRESSKLSNEGVSVIIPVIRPVLARRTVEACRRQRTERSIEILAEEDTERIGCPRMVKRLVERTSHQWVMFLGDDTVPEEDIVEEAFRAAEILQDGWGLVGLNDGHNQGSRLATHWMAHKNLLPELGGEFFHTGYSHAYCDHELMHRCRLLGRYVYARDARLIHDHPVWRKEGLTGDYARVYLGETYMKDLILFRRRERAKWRGV